MKKVVRISLLAVVAAVILIPIINWVTYEYGQTGWQWVIGIGFAVLYPLLLTLGIKLYDAWSGYFENYRIISVLNVILTAANLVLFLVNGEYYAVTAIIVYLTLIGTSVASAYFAHDDYEDGWMAFDIVIIIGNVIATIAVVAEIISNNSLAVVLL